jgi:hypothetical protein
LTTAELFVSPLQSRSVLSTQSRLECKRASALATHRCQIRDSQRDSGLYRRSSAPVRQGPSRNGNRVRESNPGTRTIDTGDGPSSGAVRAGRPSTARLPRGAPLRLRGTRDQSIQTLNRSPCSSTASGAYDIAVLASALPTGIASSVVTRDVNTPPPHCIGLREGSVIRFAGIDEPGDDQDGTYVWLRRSHVDAWTRRPAQVDERGPRRTARFE